MNLSLIPFHRLMVIRMMVLMGRMVTEGMKCKLILLREVHIHQLRQSLKYVDGRIVIEIFQVNLSEDLHHIFELISLRMILRSFLRQNRIHTLNLTLLIGREKSYFED